MINNNVFSREDTRAIKGVAVIMMLMHHLVAFPARYPVGFDGFKSLWNVWVDLLILVLISLASSVLLEFIYSKINYISNRIKNRKHPDKPKSKTESPNKALKTTV